MILFVIRLVQNGLRAPHPHTDGHDIRDSDAELRVVNHGLRKDQCGQHA